MVKFELKIGDSGLSYIPKELREILTKDVTIIPNNCATIMYPSKTELSDVAKSVRRLLEELDDKVEKESKEWTNFQVLHLQKKNNLKEMF